MSRVTVDLPEEALSALRASGQEAGAEVRMAAAAKLYELGRLSSGAAAQLAGVPRTVFLKRLSEYGVAALDLTEEELRGETRLA